MSAELTARSKAKVLKPVVPLSRKKGSAPDALSAAAFHSQEAEHLVPSAHLLAFSRSTSAQTGKRAKAGTDHASDGH